MCLKALRRGFPSLSLEPDASNLVKTFIFITTITNAGMEGKKLPRRRAYRDECVCKHGQHFQQSMDQPGLVASPARGQLKWGGGVPVPVRAR